jgi:membrane protein implicated in regulation of membrane protease activity
VCNDSDQVIPAGERAQIARVDGLTLLVQPNT